MKSPTPSDWDKVYSDAPYKREPRYLLWFTGGIILLIGVVQLVKGLL